MINLSWKELNEFNEEKELQKRLDYLRKNKRQDSNEAKFMKWLWEEYENAGPVYVSEDVLMDFNLYIEDYEELLQDNYIEEDENMNTIPLKHFFDVTSNQNWPVKNYIRRNSNKILSWQEESKEIQKSLENWINWYIGELDANFSEQERSLDDITFDEIIEDLDDAKSIEPLQSSISNYALAQAILNQINSQNRFGKISNQLWPSVDTQTTELEDRTYVNPVDDIEMRRENPPGYNKRRDWYNYVDEEGKDSEVSVRNDQTSLISGASRKLGWKKLPIKEKINHLIMYATGTMSLSEAVEQMKKDAKDYFLAGQTLEEFIYDFEDMLSDYIGNMFGSDEEPLESGEYESDQLGEYLSDNRSKIRKYIKDLITSQKQSSWRKILSEYDPAPGFIPTNNGMRTSEDIIDEASYNSYAANRDYDKDDPNYDPEKSRLRWRKFWMKHAGWPEEKINKFEKRYARENE